MFLSFLCRYYAICFLNQLFLSQSNQDLATRLISIYFSLFGVSYTVAPAAFVLSQDTRAYARSRGRAAEFFLVLVFKYLLLGSALSSWPLHPYKNACRSIQ